MIRPTTPFLAACIRRTGLVLLASLVLLIPSACRIPGPAVAPAASESTASLPGRSAPPPTREPVIRVRLRKNTAELLVSAAGPITVGTSPSSASNSGARAMLPPLRITRGPAGFVCQSANTRQAWQWPAPSLYLSPSPGAAMHLADQTFTGTLTLTAADDGRFDVVNHLGLESYLPGVVESEMYGSWHEQAFMAQAVAARSYAITRLTEQAGRHYDVEATQADQAFSGAARQPRVAAAVAATRGVVLTWDGRVLPAYYSSTKGPIGQDAGAAFPTRMEYPPLRGRSDQGWGQRSPHYQWGPIVRPLTTLSARIAAWGRTTNHAVANLGTLRSVVVTQRSSAGRPAAFSLIDDRGGRYSLTAEAFRTACNHEAPGLTALPSDAKLKSSHVDVAVSGTQVVFSNGRGFGHGVGMCQWGAQAMSTAGHRYAAILGFYYPGAALRRAY